MHTGAHRLQVTCHICGLSMVSPPADGGQDPWPRLHSQIIEHLQADHAMRRNAALSVVHRMSLENHDCDPEGAW